MILATTEQPDGQKGHRQEKTQRETLSIRRTETVDVRLVRPDKLFPVLD